MRRYHTAVHPLYRCMDPVCDTHRLKFKHELDAANFRIQQLEKQLQSRWFPVSPTVRTVGSSLRLVILYTILTPICK